MIRTRRVRHQPAWYDESVQNARRERRRCERKWRKSRSNIDYEQYRESKQKVCNEIRNAKTTYYENKLNNCSVKDMFQTINELLHTSNKAIPDTQCPEDLANEFGKFFIGKVTTIRNEVDNQSSNSLSSNTYMESSPVTCLFSEFQQITNEELLSVIKRCPNKSCALDPIPTWLVKQHIATLLPTLCRIVNTSLQSGVFPDELHRAIVTPVLKKVTLDHNELKHYRPVSNLQFTSKVLEKCASTQIIEHTEKHDLSEPMQSAYRRQHSTETALACVHNDILRALDDQKAVLLLMLDLSAAFDTVDHEIMLHRIRNDFGVTGIVHKWYSSYFSNRSCRVFVSGSYSETLYLDFGVPQGSVTGPLCFVYYTHVVGRILRHHNVKYHIYADDIQVYLTPDPSIPGDVQCALFKLSRCVADIQHWMVENKLKLNQDKTEFFVAASPYNMKKLGNISLLLDNVEVFPSKSIRNLGVVFDNQMCMSDHVTQLCKSINWLIRNINRIRHFIDMDTCHNLVRALVLSRLDYCNVLLNGISKKDLNRLQRLQNKCAKLVCLKPKFEHVSPLLNKLHWLPVHERIVYKTLLYVYKSVEGLSPQYIQDCLIVKRPAEGAMRTRSSGSTNFVVHVPKKCAGDKAFSVVAPRLWNTLPASIKNATSQQSFKAMLKDYLFP